MLQKKNIAIDNKGNCKSMANYHTITTTTTPNNMLDMSEVSNIQ